MIAVWYSCLIKISKNKEHSDDTFILMPILTLIGKSLRLRQYYFGKTIRVVVAKIVVGLLPDVDKLRGFDRTTVCNIDSPALMSTATIANSLKTEWLCRGRLPILLQAILVGSKSVNNFHRLTLKIWRFKLKSTSSTKQNLWSNLWIHLKVNILKLYSTNLCECFITQNNIV